MRRSEIARLNLIEILYAASNACLNLLEISLLRQIYSPAALVNFTYLARILFGSRTLRCTPGFKTARERLKFHSTICKPQKFNYGSHHHAPF